LLPPILPRSLASAFPILPSNPTHFPYFQPEFHATQPHHPHFQPLQALQQLRPSTASRETHHPAAPSSDDEHWHVLPSDTNHTSETAKLLPLTSSRSSSLASLPPGASPPLANPPVTTTRTASPFPGTNSVRSSHPKEAREREKARGGAAAVSILNALNPQFPPPPPGTNVDATRTLRDDDTVVYAPSEGSIREEKRERGGFWAWASSGGERDRDRREIHPREDGQQDLMRMIGIKPSPPTRSVSLNPLFS
jgi:hypothetical protein